MNPMRTHYIDLPGGRQIHLLTFKDGSATLRVYGKEASRASYTLTLPADAVHSLETAIQRQNVDILSLADGGE